jgi:ribosome-associated heat shock protein Hsp15
MNLSNVGATAVATAEGGVVAEPRDDAVRLDKWLWAARLFKTRSLAAEAIAAGKVQLNGARAKRAKAVQIGDRLRVRHGPYEYLLTVRALSGRRGPAAEALRLYDEDPEGKRARATLAAQLKLLPAPAYRGKGRPTKKQRRDIGRWKGEP